MCCLMFVVLGFLIVSVGCLIVLVWMLVRLEFNVVLNSEECYVLGFFDDMLRMKLDFWFYGWVLV